MKPIIICIHQTFLRNEYLFAFRAKDETFLWNEVCKKNQKAEHHSEQQKINHKHQTPNHKHQTPNERSDQTPNTNSCFKCSKGFC